MKVIDTALLTEAAMNGMGSTERLQVYNGLDCCVTLEVLHQIKPMLRPETSKTYAFSKAMQAPILEMNMHGVLIDQYQLSKLLAEFRAGAKRLMEQWDYLCLGVLDRKVSMTSPAQLKDLFYVTFRLPEIKKRNAKGQRVPTVDRAALEQLQAYFFTQPFISHILGYRDLQKKIQFLETGIDSDSRLRTSFNIAGTNTGRLASNYSDFGSGTNLQNIERKLRRVIVSDPGYKFCNIDLEQGDSRGLGYLEGVLFDDWRYLDACESGDLHTAVCRMAWTDLPWTGDPTLDRAIAERPFYRMFSYRDMAKRLGHGTNFLGTPYTMAKNTQLPQKVVKDFQAAYFKAFPAHSRFHDYVRQELILHKSLTTPYGRKRHFFGRSTDDNVVREAVAYMPQSMTADAIDTALLNIWDSRLAQCLLQVHDSILMQYPVDQEDELVPRLLKLAESPLYHNGRRFCIPVEAKIGWNWADADKNNLDGLAKWKGHDTRTRTESPKTSVLDRVVC